jgi:hypothetical protein
MLERDDSWRFPIEFTYADAYFAHAGYRASSRRKVFFHLSVFGGSESWRSNWYGTCTIDGFRDPGIDTMDVQLPLIHRYAVGVETTMSSQTAPLRFPLVWPVYLWIPTETAPMVGKTVSLGADSFYCIVPQAIQRTTRLCCHIVIPSRHDSLALKCDVQVIRSEKSSNCLQFGIECLIEQYSVVRWNGLRTDGD